MSYRFFKRLLRAKRNSSSSLDDYSNPSTPNAPVTHNPGVQTGEEATEITGIAHHQLMSGKVVGHQDDPVDSRVLEDIRRLLQLVKNNREGVEKLLNILQRMEDVQLQLDTLQVLTQIPDIPTWLRSSIFKAIVHLSKESQLLPHALVINNVGKLGNEPVDGGAFGDLYKGNIQGMAVALKVPRVFKRSNVQNIWKHYMREALVWQQLAHPNVLPFIGVSYTNEKTRLCLVSPWMENGNLSDFLETVSYRNVNHYLLVHDVACGLAYLHQNKIVQGHLNGTDVLITPEGRACLAGFGGSRLVDSEAIDFCPETEEPTIVASRWAAPELLSPSEADTFPLPTVFSDMYAFAGVCYEIFARKVPFYEYPDRLVRNVIREGQYPSRPDISLLNDSMWEIMTECWRQKPGERPAASEVVTRVDELGRLKTEIRPAPSWDCDQILKDVKHPALDTQGLVHLWEDLKPLVEDHGATRIAVNTPASPGAAPSVEELG